MSAPRRTIIFAAGGTGGHVIPAYVLAKKIKATYPDVHCLFVGAKGKFEARWIPEQGFDIELLDMGGVTSGSLLKRLKGLLKLPLASWHSWNILKKHKPERLFGVGGYASAPIMFLASLNKIPCAIIEPNAVAGRSNRWVSKLCQRVYTVFEQAHGYFPPEKIKHFGHLIRQSILEIPPPDFKQTPLTVTVLCGSQGSQHINRVFCKMVQSNPAYFKNNIRILHQAGPKNIEGVRAAYKEANVDAQVFGFIDDISTVYAQSHIIVGRSGSLVIECASVGIPSVLIPLAIAADDHQKENACSLLATGGIRVIEEKSLDEHTLLKAIDALISDDLKNMSLQLRTLRKPYATDKIMQDFMSLKVGM